MTAPQNWTVKSILHWMKDDFLKRGIESPRLDAEILLARALGCSRVNLYMDLEKPLRPEELKEVRGLVERRRNREPIAYILGTKEFYGRSFAVTPAVLIPRPDTETLVEAMLGYLDEASVDSVLDLCSGSGAIGLTLAAERANLRIVLADVSESAMEVAKLNAAALGVEGRVVFETGDLSDALRNESPFQLVACNPPYLKTEELAGLAPDVRDHEPSLALVGGDDGLAFYRRLAEQSARLVLEGGRLFLEVGFGQAGAVSELLSANGFERVAIHQDLAGVERVVELKRTS